jgi:hypothetical protein
LIKRLRREVEIVFERAGMYEIIGRDACGFKKIHGSLVWEGLESSMDGLEDCVSVESESFETAE